MACNCSKRNVVRQITVKKTPNRPVSQRQNSGKRIVRRVIR